MDLSYGIPITLALGLITFAIMFAFIEACEKV
jgi:hypothetical protein